MAFLISSLLLLLLTSLAVLAYKSRGATVPSAMVEHKKQSSFLGKQYPEASIEQKRTTFLLSGLLIALLFAIVLVEYPTWIRIAEEEVEELVTLEAQTLSIPPTRIQPPRPPQPEQPKVEIVTPPEKIEVKKDEPEKEEPEKKLEIETPPPPVPSDLPPDDTDEGEAVSNIPIDANLVEQKPEFPGNMNDYIRRNLKISDRDIEEENFGIIYVQFVVNSSGQVTDVKIIKGINSRLNNSALNVVKNMPEWEPGRQGGRPVSVRYNYPIRITRQR